MQWRDLPILPAVGIDFAPLASGLADVFPGDMAANAERVILQMTVGEPGVELLSIAERVAAPDSSG